MPAGAGTSRSWMHTPPACAGVRITTSRHRGNALLLYIESSANAYINGLECKNFQQRREALQHNTIHAKKKPHPSVQQACNSILLQRPCNTLQYGKHHNSGENIRQGSYNVYTRVSLTTPGSPAWWRPARSPGTGGGGHPPHVAIPPQIRQWLQPCQPHRSIPLYVSRPDGRS